MRTEFNKEINILMKKISGKPHQQTGTCGKQSVRGRRQGRGIGSLSKG